MANQIPQTPRRPPGQDSRGSFWRGVLVTIGVVLGLYVAFNVYLSIAFRDAGSISANRLSAQCDRPQLTLVIDGGRESIERDKAGIWALADLEFGWDCGDGANARTRTCAAGTEYLVVLRYPDSDEFGIECRVPRSTFR